MRHIYLDNNATTAMRTEVVEAMAPFFAEAYGNASSIHWFGQHAKAAIDNARTQVARLIGARTTEIVFLSGGTEADNFAIRGIVESQSLKGRHIITSQIEHPAVRNTLKELEKQSFEVTWLPVGPDGILEAEQVRDAIRPDTILISVMHANNEIGTIQPIEQIGQISEETGIYFHSDGVQASGKLPVDVSALGVHLYSISSHKIHGPKGVGALFVKKGTPLKAMMTGGGHERNRRAGTENVAGIVGFGAAADMARQDLAATMVRITDLRNSMEERLKKAIPDIHINGERVPRLGNTSNIMVDYAEGEGLVISLDLKGIAVSTGSACSSGSMEPSHVLTAIGKTPDEGFGSLRISLSVLTTTEDVDDFVATLPGIVERLRELSPYCKKG
jgi:cysteine desulfurase